jgi:hypothetical protein
MTILRSLSLQRRLEAETVRHAGSLAKLVFYKGEKPLACEISADGERVASLDAGEHIVRDLFRGNEPNVVPEANYWRLLDNNGNVVMQGDCRE